MIRVFISEENRGYVWNANDWLRIRQEFRIVGDLIGSLSNYPRQDALKGLPLCLLPEEVTLLFEKKLVTLVRCPSLATNPSDSLFEAFTKQEQCFHDTQREEYTRKKKAEVEQSLHKIVQGKQRKNVKFEESDAKSLISQEIDKIQSMSANNFLSLIPTEDPWIDENDVVQSEWSFPSTNYERLKYKVFKDLWERKYYLTSGGKFGGDFLCYPGDPAKFHAFFIVICKEDGDFLSCKDFVTYGRIGTSTKKTIILAIGHFRNNEDRISYQSIQWNET